MVKRRIEGLQNGSVTQAQTALHGVRHGRKTKRNGSASQAGQAIHRAADCPPASSQLHRERLRLKLS
jgi:hypothetical protein